VLRQRHLEEAGRGGGGAILGHGEGDAGADYARRGGSEI
jgi:hypothetical protein